MYTLWHGMIFRIAQAQSAITALSAGAQLTILVDYEGAKLTSFNLKQINLWFKQLFLEVYFPPFT